MWQELMEKAVLHIFYQQFCRVLDTKQGFIPVSYTHLDVYKRQELFSFKNWKTFAKILVQGRRFGAALKKEFNYQRIVS